MPTQRPLEDLRTAVGETTSSVSGLRVEAGKVAEFARAIRADDPVHLDEAAANRRGYRGVVAPLTFVRTADFPRNRTESVGSHKHYGHDLGFDPRFEVHGEETYEYHRPLRVGDVLSGETELADVYTREGSNGEMTFADLETIYRDADGDPVVTQTTTSLELTDVAREATDSEGADDGDGPPDPADRHVGDPETPAESRTKYPGESPDGPGELEVGDPGPTRVLDGLKRTDFVRYAGASGDFNPIHYDEPYATGAGNPSVFGQGMLLCGFMSTVPAEWFGLGRVRRFATRFTDRIWPGDTITVTATVGEVEPSDTDDERTVEGAEPSGTDDDRTVVEVELEATNQDDATLATATSTVEPSWE
jgi:acyl dehydratase